jgi:hypothetical protein
LAVLEGKVEKATTLFQTISGILYHWLHGGDRNIRPKHPGLSALLQDGKGLGGQ